MRQWGIIVILQKNYSTIAKSLTDLLKKDNFLWSTAIEAAFPTLKHALILIIMLALHDFSTLFIMETDACHSAEGVVLH